MAESMAFGSTLAVIILAAGASKRLGQAKQLISVNGRSLLQHQIDIAKTLNAPVYVILGAGSESILASNPVGASLVINDDWREGITSSIRVGLQQSDADAWLFMTVDQYRIKTSHLQSLAGAWAMQPDKLVVSSYQGAMGVPAIIPRSERSALLALRGDNGAGGLIRDIYEKSPARIISIEDEKCAIDLDTDDDLAVFNNYNNFEQLDGRELCSK